MAAYPITLDRVTVTSAGTPVVLSATAIFASTIILEGDVLNTGNIYWGGSGVSSTKGHALAAGQIIMISADTHKFDTSHGNDQKLDLSKFYVDADTNSNKVRVSYLPWAGGLG